MFTESERRKEKKTVKYLEFSTEYHKSFQQLSAINKNLRPLSFSENNTILTILVWLLVSFSSHRFEETSCLRLRG
jgi:hypothetical protein